MLIRERKERQERQIQEIALGSARAENLLLSTVAETLQVDLFRRLRGPALVALGIVVGTVANIAATYNSLQHWVAAAVVDHRRVNETHDTSCSAGWGRLPGSSRGSASGSTRRPSDVYWSVAATSSCAVSQCRVCAAGTGHASSRSGGASSTWSSGSTNSATPVTTRSSSPTSTS